MEDKRFKELHETVTELTFDTWPHNDNLVLQIKLSV